MLTRTPPSQATRERFRCVLHALVGVEDLRRAVEQRRLQRFQAKQPVNVFDNRHDNTQRLNQS